MEQNLRFGLVLGWLEENSPIKVKYATFEGNFLCFHGQNVFEFLFLNIIAFALKKMINVKVRKP